MRAILRYTDCLEDGKNVIRVLARKNVEILWTKQRFYSIYPEVMILVNSRQELNNLLDELNKNCTYEVRLIKTQKSRVCDCCSKRDHCSSIKKIFRIFCE